MLRGLAAATTRGKHGYVLATELGAKEPAARLDWPLQQCYQVFRFERARAGSLVGVPHRRRIDELDKLVAGSTRVQPVRNITFWL